MTDTKHEVVAEAVGPRGGVVVLIIAANGTVTCLPAIYTNQKDALDAVTAASPGATVTYKIAYIDAVTVIKSVNS